MFEQPDLRPINSKGQYVLKADYAYVWFEPSPIGILSRSCRLTVKQGFICDIATTTWIGWIFGYLPDGLYRAAALMHDLLYQLQGRLSSDGSRYLYEEFDAGSGQWLQADRQLSRKQCDDLFLRIMKDAGVGAKANAMYFAVRAFGGFAWGL